MLRFANFQKLAGANIMQNLLGTGRPENFYGNYFRRAEAEMKTLVAGADIAAGRGREASLAIHGNLSAVSIAITAASPEGNRKPMVIILIAIEEEDRGASESANDCIYAAIVIDVSKGRPARRQGCGDTGIGAFEMAMMIDRQ